MKRSLTGQHAEEEACRYLIDSGYLIVKRNYRTRWAEIDIVVSKKDLFVFVEVRSRTGDTYGLPEESLSHQKLHRMARAALAYLAYNKKVLNYRIDAICVVFDDLGLVQRLDHYENVTG